MPVKPVGFVDESVGLVVLPCGNAHQLLRFMVQLYERLHDHDNYGSIVRGACSSDGSTAITILLQPAKLGNLVIKLANLPEVEKVEEEPLAGDAFDSFPKNVGGLLTSGISPSKRFCITLKETSMTRPELATVLN